MSFFGLKKCIDYHFQTRRNVYANKAEEKSHGKDEYMANNWSIPSRKRTYKHVSENREQEWLTIPEYRGNGERFIKELKSLRSSAILLRGIVSNDPERKKKFEDYLEKYSKKYPDVPRVYIEGVILRYLFETEF